MENRLSRKALRLLCSPLSLGAMAVLLINDHLLRRFWPSWVTGKLGDFAWLLFFPFALAWVLAFILPRRERLVRGLSFGMTGGIFALAKTFRFSGRLTERFPRFVWNMLYGNPKKTVLILGNSLRDRFPIQGNISGRFPMIFRTRFRFVFQISGILKLPACLLSLSALSENSN